MNFWPDPCVQDGLALGRRPTVCVQGLGFVGAAMAVAVASARQDDLPVYNVVGVDLPTEQGLSRIEALNRGDFPFATTDEKLRQKTRQAHATGNLVAHSDASAFETASVIIVDVPFDVKWVGDRPGLELDEFRSAVRSVGAHMRSDALVIIETTVPPGTTAHVAAPVLRQELRDRDLPADSLRLAHSYERVMPGSEYFDSIVNMWRVYAGIDEPSADACEQFLSSVINVADYPLTRLSSTTASELAKTLENTFRAVTIALMDEWGDFAERIGIDLFEVVSSIRMRGTHSNMRTPGFGVGGYCLTKDPMMGELSAREVFQFDHAFPFSSLAVATNSRMPRRALDKLKGLLGGSLQGKRILLMGVSYREGVGDTRYSPASTFFRAARHEGADMRVHDPLVEFWDEHAMQVPRDLPSAEWLDAVVLAVPHQEYKRLDYAAWLRGHALLIFDTCDVLSADQRRGLRALGCRVESIGRGGGL
jgi:nucleotide sugar dehydrogenase